MGLDNGADGREDEYKRKIKQLLGPGIYIMEGEHLLSAVELSRASFPASMPLDLGGADQSPDWIVCETPTCPEREVDELRKSTQVDWTAWRGRSITMCQVPFSIFLLVFARVTA
jgi:hypothetical protein